MRPPSPELGLKGSALGFRVGDPLAALSSSTSSAQDRREDEARSMDDGKEGVGR